MLSTMSLRRASVLRVVALVQTCDLQAWLRSGDLNAGLVQCRGDVECHFTSELRNNSRTRRPETQLKLQYTVTEAQEQSRRLRMSKYVRMGGGGFAQEIADHRRIISVSDVNVQGDPATSSS